MGLIRAKKVSRRGGGLWLGGGEGWRGERLRMRGTWQEDKIFSAEVPQITVKGIVSRDEYLFWKSYNPKQYFLNDALMVFTIFSCLLVKEIQKEVLACFFEPLTNPKSCSEHCRFSEQFLESQAGFGTGYFSFEYPCGQECVCTPFALLLGFDRSQNSYKRICHSVLHYYIPTLKT